MFVQAWYRRGAAAGLNSPIRRGAMSDRAEKLDSMLRPRRMALVGCTEAGRASRLVSAVSPAIGEAACFFRSGFRSTLAPGIRRIISAAWRIRVARREKLR